MPLTPGSRLGPYLIDAPIGQGGMGEVYRATDANLKRAVALKVLPESVAADTDRLARFQREAEVLAALNHPHIAAIYGLERSAGTTALVMELVEGPTLADRIAAGTLPIDDVRSIARQIAEALEAAHEQGIVHRDLKPANVKVRPDGVVKVLDFGLAKAVSAAPDPKSDPLATPSVMPTLTTPAMTMAGMILGTAAYMAPEQAKGRPVDRRADVWAFGAVLYEMLTGRRAFDGDDISEVLASVLAREPDWTPLSGVPSSLATCVRRCLQRDPKQRFGDMQSVRLGLEGAFDPAPGAAGGERPARPARSAMLPWAVAGAATLALVVLGSVYWRQAAPDRPVIRTMITPPKNTAFDFDVTVGPAVLSPDGRMVAFSARTTAGQIQLWIRSLDQPEARPIEGTDGASFPFWSPDSRSVGFYNPGSGRLERVDVAGGAPVVVARASFVRGASWGANGTIAYDSSQPGNRIMAVQPGSDTPRVVVTAGLPRSPWFLPDGRHFLYYSRESRQVRVTSVDGGSSEAVTEASSSAIYASGRLLFLREGTLLAQPFDLTRRAVSGSPAAVARGVQMLLGDPRGIYSASDTGLLLYQDGAETAATSLAWFNRDGTRQAVVGDMGSARCVRLSPDNAFAIVALLDADGHLDLWRVSTATGERLRLTFEPESTELSAFATWSPDGRFIGYGVRRGQSVALERRPAVGGREERLYEVPAEQMERRPPRVTAWTSDGAALVYSGENHGGLWTLPLSAAPGGTALTARQYVRDPDTALNPRVSPNGRWVAYQAALGGESVPGIFVESFPGGGRRQQVSDRGTLPVWGADGRAFYYARDNILSVVEVTEADAELRFGTPRAVMPVVTGRGYSYDIARDGRILALVTSEQRASRPLTLVQNWTALVADR